MRKTWIVGVSGASVVGDRVGAVVADGMVVELLSIAVEDR
jgi:hypothetical protein